MHDVRDFREELLGECYYCLQTDHDAAREEDARDSEGAEGFDLAVAGREACCGLADGV